MRVILPMFGARSVLPSVLKHFASRWAKASGSMCVCRSHPGWSLMMTSPEILQGSPRDSPVPWGLGWGGHVSQTLPRLRGTCGHCAVGDLPRSPQGSPCVRHRRHVPASDPICVQCEVAARDRETRRARLPHPGCVGPPLTPSVSWTMSGVPDSAGAGPLRLCRHQVPRPSQPCGASRPAGCGHRLPQSTEETPVLTASATTPVRPISTPCPCQLAGSPRCLQPFPKSLRA